VTSFSVIKKIGKAGAKQINKGKEMSYKKDMP